MRRDAGEHRRAAVQPRHSRGILLPTLHIIARDRDAPILILPSDHYVADEPVLEEAMRAALREVGVHRRGVALMGIEADEPDPELGYIVAEPGDIPGSRTFGDSWRSHPSRRHGCAGTARSGTVSSSRVAPRVSSSCTDYGVRRS